MLFDVCFLHCFEYIIGLLICCSFICMLDDRILEATFLKRYLPTLFFCFCVFTKIISTIWLFMFFSLFILFLLMWLFLVRWVCIDFIYILLFFCPYTLSSMPIVLNRLVQNGPVLLILIPHIYVCPILNETAAEFFFQTYPVRRRIC